MLPVISSIASFVLRMAKQLTTHGHRFPLPRMEITDPKYIGSISVASVLSVADQAARLALALPVALGKLIKQADGTVWILKPCGQPSVAGDWELVAQPASVGTSIDLRPDITGLTGGAATDLDGIPTVGKPLGYTVAIYISGPVGYTYLYRLCAGWVEENAPKFVMPDDYDEYGGNEKHWTQVGLCLLALDVTGSSRFRGALEVDGAFSLKSPFGDFRGYFEAGNISEGRNWFLPDMSGTLAVLPFFDDDAAAALGGLAVGDAYFNGTKTRVRMA
jgi:hypothetical protein